ncbi:MAG: hypothetical protein ACK5MQ_15835, partial [Pikeienuella sp.]
PFFARPILRPALACAAAAAFGLWLGHSTILAEAAETLLAGGSQAVQAYVFGNGDSFEVADFGDSGDGGFGGGYWE